MIQLQHSSSVLKECLYSSIKLTITLNISRSTTIYQSVIVNNKLESKIRAPPLGLNHLITWCVKHIRSNTMHSSTHYYIMIAHGIFIIHEKFTLRDLKRRQMVGTALYRADGAKCWTRNHALRRNHYTSSSCDRLFIIYTCSFLNSRKIISLTMVQQISLIELIMVSIQLIAYKIYWF